MIKKFSDFTNESKINEDEIDLETFKDYFNKNYSHISHNLKDKEIQKFLKDNKKYSIEKIADYFSDYILSNGLEDEISL